MGKRAFLEAIKRDANVHIVAQFKIEKATYLIYQMKTMPVVVYWITGDNFKWMPNLWQYDVKSGGIFMQYLETFNDEYDKIKEAFDSGEKIPASYASVDDILEENIKLRGLEKLDQLGKLEN